MPRLRAVLLPFALLALLAAAGCGGSESDDAEGAAAPAEAVAEIATIKAMLDDAVAKVRAGDRDAAETTVGDAYLEHFEHVEAPLGERDHDFMEELEEDISTHLRDDIKDGDPVAEIESSVADIKADLDRAVEVLQR